MRTWPFGLVILAAALLFGLASHGSRANESQDAGDTPFGNKIVLLEVKGSYSTTLKSVVVKKLGDRTFLVGTALRDSPLTRESYPGKVVWLPVSDVEQIIEFDDIAQMRKTGADR
jgi:hypothetical protein